MQIKFDKVFFTYNANSPFSVSALTDINLSLNENNITEICMVFIDYICWFHIHNEKVYWWNKFSFSILIYMNNFIYVIVLKIKISKNKQSQNNLNNENNNYYLHDNIFHRNNFECFHCYFYPHHNFH